VAESTPREELVDAFAAVGFETWLHGLVASGHLAPEDIRCRSEGIDVELLYDLTVPTPSPRGFAWAGSNECHPVVEWTDAMRDGFAGLPADAVLVLDEQKKDHWPSLEQPSSRLAIVPAAPGFAGLEHCIQSVDFFVSDPIGRELTSFRPNLHRGLLSVQQATLHLVDTAHSLKWFLIDGSSLSAAGADPADTLALILLLGAEYARQMVAGGLSWDAAPTRLGIRQPIVNNPFFGIAQLRALRWTWSHFSELCGTRSPCPVILTESLPAPVESAGNSRATEAPNHVAIFRATALGFASMLGGATHVMLPKPSSLGQGSMQDALRLSLNIDRILRSEAQLNQGPDPITGCRFLESITQDLASKAWHLFQSVERAGGIAVVGADGIHEVLRMFRKEVADGQST
jgi:hypothetical protein